MKKSMGMVLSALAAAAMLAACNSGSNNTTPGVGTNCNGPANGMIVLYPKPGAKNIGANVGGVYVATKPALPAGNSYDFFVVQSNGATQYTSTFATYSGPIPNPHVTPPAGYTVYATAFANLIGPLQTVNLYWNDGGTGCTPNNIVSTFSTE